MTLTNTQVTAAAAELGRRGGAANTAAQRAWRSRAKPGAGRPRLPEITTAQVEALEQEAAQAGDDAQVAICRRALDGSQRAWRECQRVIRAAQAQA